MNSELENRENKKEIDSLNDTLVGVFICVYMRIFFCTQRNNTRAHKHKDTHTFCFLSFRVL